eukprot:TRINITY_DN3610_c0_g1_i2.p1 TRINITY_DN3610_c0_g1~~TRINITY_DN3610_c0_g1_i2.p1  ORF type:complete len:318 (-),score=42.37 TRINITY_DN3610_c0_g1_i2:123-1076(-)
MDNDEIWVYFDATIWRMASLLSDEDVWTKIIYDGINSLINDGVQHLEMRGFMNYIMQNGKRKYNTTQIIFKWLQIIQDINKNVSPEEQFTVKFIYVLGRWDSSENIYQGLVNTINLQQGPTGNYVIGFDIVDEEYRFNSLLHYIDTWLDIEKYALENSVNVPNYFFHAGETNWNKGDCDNLIDAVLLNTTRIGHGYALRDTPILMDIIKRKNIAIEVCPLSNQLLRLLVDVRNHPAVCMMNEGVQITISSDDPVIYGYEGVTFDFYSAYVSWDLHLKSMKKIVFNSIDYSGLHRVEKQQARQRLEQRWDDWILSMLN